MQKRGFLVITFLILFTLGNLGIAYAIQPRFEQGKFGQGIMIEEGTTNQAGTDNSFKTGVNGFVAYGDSSSTLTSSTDYAFNGTHSLKTVCVAPGTSGYGVVKTISNPSSWQGKTVTLTWRMRGVGSAIGKKVYPDIYYTTGDITSPAITLTGDWQTLSCTGTIPSSGVSGLYIYWLSHASNPLVAGDIVYADCVQFEEKAYSTSFIDGTRAAETLTIPTVGLLNASEGEFSIYYQQPNDYNFSTPAYKDILDVQTNAGITNRFLILRKGANSANSYTIYIRSGSTWQNHTLNLTSGVFHRITWTWKNGGTYSIIVDGVVVKTGTYVTGDLSFDKFALTGNGISIIDDLRISSKARTDAEILASYQSDKPLPVDKYTTYKLDLDTNWSWEGESINGLTGRFSGPVTSSTDKVVGNYSAKVNTQDDPYGSGHYWFKSPLKYLDSDSYSKVSIWVKPGPNAKQLRFWVFDEADNRNEQINNDKNRDGYFIVGEDIESGKWNQVTLDLKQTDGGGILKYASNLQLITNEFSTWYWDDAKTIYSPLIKLDISTMLDSHTQITNGSVRLNGTTAYDTTPTVVTTLTDTQAFTKGRVEKVLINSNYVDTTRASTELQSSYKIVPGVYTNRLVSSGNGNKLFYINSSDNKLYEYNKTTNVIRNLAAHTDITTIKTDYTGEFVFFTRSSGYLWYYRTSDNSTVQIAYQGAYPSFDVSNDGSLTYYYQDQYGYDLRVRTIDGGNHIIGGVGYYPRSVANSRDGINHFYISDIGLNAVIKRIELVQGLAWKETELITTPKLLSSKKILSNKDGSNLYVLVYIDASRNDLYSIDVKNKILKKTSIENVSDIVKVSDDNKLFYLDKWGDFMIYDPNKDESVRFRPIPVSYWNIFSIDNSGTKYFYNETNGISMANVNEVVKPEKYVLSFDGRQSWVTYKEGMWYKISNSVTPTVSEVQTNGMTVDDVNALGPDEFAQMYQAGEETYSVDVAMLFQTPDPSISPQLNSISVSMSGEGVIGVTLQYPKQQVDYDSTNWRTIKRIYPIELQPKQADVAYFLSNDGGTTLKAYRNGQWETYQSSLLAQPSQNWSEILQDGMTKEELKAIPSDKLTAGLLPAAKASVVYITEVDDSSAAEYSSKITVDYVENQFTKTSLTLTVILTSGERQDFTGLSRRLSR